MTSEEVNKLSEGTVLTYTGKGFLGFDRNDRKMKFIGKAKEYGPHDIYVRYKEDITLLVMLHEVELP